ncbi:hypothetical protein TUBRATIS_14270 [Tubulinosema ratisbonensis]|uniref:Uncharacterized protein n=1 Tax=Tubulinosema ratisbonensis TaxID=291195 RepID=A0A437ALT7_9MICR|nr:hypothetical protein TUBRATIS_14270 [Tubulinosema ratisbonensis]
MSLNKKKQTWKLSTFKFLKWLVNKSENEDSNIDLTNVTIRK